MSLIRLAALGAIAAACLAVIYLGPDERGRPDVTPPAPATAPIAVVPLPAQRPLALERQKPAKPALKPAPSAAAPEPPAYSCTLVRWATSVFTRAQLDAMAATNHTTPQQRAAALRCLNH
jgi:hypothetical protein